MRSQGYCRRSGTTRIPRRPAPQEPIPGSDTPKSPLRAAPVVHHPPPAAPAAPNRGPHRPPKDAPAERQTAAGKSLSRYGAIELPAPKVPSNIHCLTIIGQIEGHLVLPPQNKTTKYEHSIPQLVAIELNPDIEGLLVVLNTVGGDVEAGLAIAEMVASLSKPKVSLVVGGGHSIGVPIAVAADRSFITHTATMTIHPIRLSGLVVGVPQTYEYLDKMQDRVVKFIVANSRISEQRFRDLMFRTGELARDVGTVLVGHDAVRIGLIDDVGGLEQAISALQGMIAERRKRHPHSRGEASRTARATARAARWSGQPAGPGPSPGFYPGPAPAPEPAGAPGTPPGAVPAEHPSGPVAPDDDDGPGPWLPRADAGTTGRRVPERDRGGREL